MGKVHIVQLLCPSRHCILAATYVEGEGTRQEAIDGISALMKELNVNLHCGICGSAKLEYDDTATPFDTMEDAAPTLELMMRSNIQTRAMLDEAGISYDEKQRRAGSN